MLDGNAAGSMEFRRSILHGVEIKRCKNSPHAYKPHVHQELSLGYIVEGSTELTLNDKALFYQTGDGVIIPPLTTHRCAPKDAGHWAYVMLFVDPGYYSGKVSFGQAKKMAGEQAGKLMGFMEQLLTEKIPDTLENILIDLLLEFGEKDVSQAPAHDAGDTAQVIHDYLLDHVGDEITLDQLQKMWGLNKFSIIRNFKKAYMTTPAAFHLQCRVARAKRLLSQGAGVFDICEELKFYDQAHFIREFRKMYGVTPGAYTEQLKG
jgi:AraC-like DNA-binding protein